MESEETALVELLRELQAYETQFTDHYKAASAMGTWYIDLLQKNCIEKEGVILMAWDGTESLGMAAVFMRVEEKGEEEELAHTYAHIGELVVAEKARGRGIGNALLEECERRARAAGRGEITLAVFAKNKFAKRLYHDFGFEDLKINQRKKLS
jgi:ribosomal protein S18 acetylase RimI-like enzyme